MALALLIAAVPSLVMAFDLETGARAAYWSSSRNLNDERNLTPLQAWVRSGATYTLDGAAIGFHGEGWIEALPRGTPRRVDGRDREAYAQLSTGPFEFRAGWQIFPWGRADAINPTDNLSPRQYTLLTRDMDDQRFGIPAVRATWFDGPLSVNAIWLAGFQPSVLPWPPGAPAIQDLKPRQPTGQAAVRVELVREALEGSLSCFDGYDVLPTQAVLATALAPSAAPRILLFHDRLKIVGGDIARPVGRFALRSEIAYMEPPAARSDAIFARQRQIYAVAGGDRSFGEYFNVNLQLYWRHVEGSATPPDLPEPQRAIAQVFAVTGQQYDHNDRGITFRISDQWYNETLEAEVAGLFSVQRSSYVIRPLIKYRVTDEWTASVGGEILGGDGRSFYGFLRDDTTGYLEIRRGF
jgi:hypothetical protein